jgi:RNA polymerase sigma factor for flagellar operon FliA
MGVAESHMAAAGKEHVTSRDEKILRYLPYVKRIVNRIAAHLPPTVDREDLMNVGVIGLIQAIDRYDPCRDNKFTTYAAFRIRGAVLSELRSRDYLSRSSRRKTREMEKTCHELEQQLGREVDDEELAAAMDIDLEQLHQIRQAACISFISFEELGVASARDKEKLANSLLVDDEDALSQAGLKELRRGLAEAIATLPDKEKMVLSLYYSDELTMKEAGEVLGVTESRVSQLHSQAVLRLRSRLRKKHLLDP